MRTTSSFILYFSGIGLMGLGAFFILLGVLFCVTAYLRTEEISIKAINIFSGDQKP